VVINDWVLLSRVGRDPNALQTLFERHRDFVYRLAWSQLRDQTSAEDVTQDVFVRLAASTKPYFQRAAFRTWLYRVSSNCVHDHRRKNTGPATVQPGNNPAIGGSQESCSDLQRVLEALDDLPRRQRQVVVLRLFEGFSVAETASALGCGSGAVKTHLHRATQKLRKRLLGQTITTGD